MPSFHTKICGWKLLRFVYVDAWVARVCMYKNVTKRWLLLSGFFFFFKLRYDRNDAIGVMNIWCCWTLYSHILDIFLSICLIPSIIQTSLSIYTGRKWNQVIRVYWKVLLEFLFLLKLRKLLRSFQRAFECLQWRSFSDHATREILLPILLCLVPSMQLCFHTLRDSFNLRFQS